MIRVGVDIPGREYEVLVGPGSRSLMEDMLPSGVEKVAVVTQEHLSLELHPGVPFEVVLVPQGERAKSLGVLEEVCGRFARMGLSRSDAVVALGGGVVTDLAGFAAASYHRGIAYLNVPTTLLAQVDAAIGGKTGVNLREGKNLVGAFWQPAGVLCDTELLTGLPEREWRSGRGEMAKYAFLSSPGEPERVASMGAGMLSLPLEEQVAHCVAIKAGVVAADEREGSRRAILNYGHTLAHALEADAIARGRDDAIRHGEAVAIGLVFAARLAMRLGRIGSERVAEHEAVVRGFGLDYRLPAGWDSSALVGYMLRDKKAHHDLTFVLDGPRGVELVTGVDQGDVLATLSDMPVADGLDSHQGL